MQASDHSLQFIIFLTLIALVGGLIIYIAHFLSQKKKPAKILPQKQSDNTNSEPDLSFLDAVTMQTPPVPLSDPLAMIETHALKKTYISREKGKNTVVDAVRGITFSVTRGEIFGLLGPNGAGKTTTMRMLSTLLEPNGGEAKIAGYSLSSEQHEIRVRIGYVSQVGGMQRETTGRENLLLQARLYGMNEKDSKARVDELLALLDVASFADRKTATYSGGQRRIFDLASGIVHRPLLLFLDEPSTGLDPQNRVHIWEQVKKLSDQGTTIFVTTHYLEEADALCDRVAIMDKGEIAAIGTPEELKREIARDTVTLVLGDDQTAQIAHSALSGNMFITDMQVRENTLLIFVTEGATTLPAIISTIHEKGIAIISIELSRPTLDDVF